MYTDTARQGWRRVRRATARAGWLGVLLACCGVAAAQSVIIYPRPESLGDERAAYPIALLKLSLSKVGNPYRLAASPAQMQQGRALRLLARGKGIDRLWTGTSREREAVNSRSIPWPHASRRRARPC